MKSLFQFTVATLVMLGATLGVVKAQEAVEPPTPPAAQTQDTAQGPDGDGDGWWGRKHRRGHQGEHGMRGERGGRHGMGGMRIVDANADGVIGADEAASLAEFAFARLDDNRDSTLTEAEFIGGPRGMRGWFGGNSEERAAVEKVRKDNFAKLDVNKDTKLDKTEFFADAQAKLAAADTDKDGKVTPWEFRASR
jgi:hypothetical protein